MNWDTLKAELAKRKSEGVDLPSALGDTGEVVVHLQLGQGEKAAHAMIRALVAAWGAGYDSHKET